MSAQRLLLITIGVISTILLVACGGDEDVPSTPSTPAASTEETAAPAPKKVPAPVDVEADGTDASPSSGFTSVAEELRVEVEIPSYYPQDGPVYPGLNPSQVQQLPNGKVSLMFGTDAMPDEASGVMIEAAEAKGWTIVSEDTVDRGHLAQAEKDGRQLMILTNRIEGGGSDPVTLVAISIEP